MTIIIIGKIYDLNDIEKYRIHNENIKSLVATMGYHGRKGLMGNKPYLEALSIRYFRLHVKSPLYGKPKPLLDIYVDDQGDIFTDPLKIKPVPYNGIDSLDSKVLKDNLHSAVIEKIKELNTER